MLNVRVGTACQVREKTRVKNYYKIFVREFYLVSPLTVIVLLILSYPCAGEPFYRYENNETKSDEGSMKAIILERLQTYFEGRKKVP